MGAIHTRAWSAMLAAAACVVAPTLHAQGREEAKLITATSVMTELRESRDQQIPQWLLNQGLRHGRDRMS